MLMLRMGSRGWNKLGSEDIRAKLKTYRDIPLKGPPSEPSIKETTAFSSCSTNSSFYAAVLWKDFRAKQSTPATPTKCSGSTQKKTGQQQTCFQAAHLLRRTPKNVENLTKHFFTWKRHTGRCASLQCHHCRWKMEPGHVVRIF